MQDGPKIPLLCSTCEGIFSTWEDRFARDIFLPFHTGRTGRAPVFPYGHWALKFAVSLSWRTVQFLRHEAARHGKTLAAPADALSRAEKSWATFLRGEASDIGPFAQHLYPLDTLDRASASGLSPMINRYFLRAADIDFIATPKMTFAYTKMLRFFVVGLVVCEDASQWAGGLLAPGGGSFGSEAFRLPGEMLLFLSRKADMVAGAHRALSDKQRGATQGIIAANLDRMASSEAFRAMRADVEMFGDKAFAVTKGSRSDDDGAT